jgi:predicted fused transcriptional regulator/phosphomethylpyrimidine kinase
MLESYGWKLIEVDRANPIPENATFSEEVEDMLERTSSNPNAIIHGILHNYPVM